MVIPCADVGLGPHSLFAAAKYVQNPNSRKGKILPKKFAAGRGLVSKTIANHHLVLPRGMLDGMVSTQGQVGTKCLDKSSRTLGQFSWL
jgi:hypothetical protein